ncbi:MAG: transcription elongation factor GreA [Anaerolineaceae bacterium]|nr:transcription elongation factor GreA [Anaerolineaceae bacterium]
MATASYLTADGAVKLKEELENLKGPARQALSLRLRHAIEQGDLSENADYTAAKEEQGFLEGRIQELENVLRNVIIIDNTVQSSNDTINIGATITIQEGSYDEETYFLVGPKEADPVNGRISYESPIGKSLIGHKINDVVDVETPNGSMKFKILKINY